MHEIISEANTLLFSRICLKIEGLCATLYHYYSEIHSDNPEAAKIWKQTALEEENHQKQLELAINLINDLDFELTSSDLRQACAIHRKLCMLLDIVRRAPPILRTALNNAIKMEERMATLHIDTIGRFKDETVQQMFQAIRDSDQEHVNSLRQFLVSVSPPSNEHTIFN
ncbi:MAG TPA: hypothetical protein VGJ93_03505 [Desulfuromonadaceae bacterium]|jgi:hypothetical protein